MDHPPGVSSSLWVDEFLELRAMTVDDGTGGILHWLYTNAPAAWISALIAVVTCVILVRRRTKPRRAVFREVRNSSLIQIWPGVRSKIGMTFDDHPINKLGQIEGEIFNEGSETIQNPTIILRLPTRSKILDVSVSPVDFGAQFVTDANEVYIKLPYLNAVGEHAQVLKVQVLADGETEPVSASGSGEGWSVRFVPLINPRADRYKFIVLCCSAGLAILGAFLYGGFVERHYGIGMNEISWRAFLYNLPVLIVLGSLAAIYLKMFSTRMNRQIRYSRTFGR